MATIETKEEEKASCSGVKYGEYLGQSGQRLKDLREAQHLSQFELSLRAGVGCDTISKIELGTRNCRIWTYYCLADALGVPLGALAGDDLAIDLSDPDIPTAARREKTRRRMERPAAPDDWRVPFLRAATETIDLSEIVIPEDASGPVRDVRYLVTPGFNGLHGMEVRWVHGGACYTAAARPFCADPAPLEALSLLFTVQRLYPLHFQSALDDFLTALRHGWAYCGILPEIDCGGGGPHAIMGDERM